MSKFDDVFLPPTPDETRRLERVSAVSQVQSSLYVRLRKAYPTRSGPVAWMLIRASQHDHPDQGAARAALAARPAAELYAMNQVAQLTLASAKSDAWRELAGAVVETTRELWSEKTKEEPVTGPRAVLKPRDEFTDAEVEERGRWIRARRDELMAAGVERFDAEEQAATELGERRGA